VRICSGIRLIGSDGKWTKQWYEMKIAHYLDDVGALCEGLVRKEQAHHAPRKGFWHLYDFTLTYRIDPFGITL
jgi:hypothetical protein